MALMITRYRENPERLTHTRYEDIAWNCVCMYAPSYGWIYNQNGWRYCEFPIYIITRTCDVTTRVFFSLRNNVRTV